MLDISNVAQVEATLLKIHELETQIAAAEIKRDKSVDFYRQLIDNAREVCRKEVSQIQFDIDALQNSLKNFYDSNPPLKGKTHKFAGGSFGYRKQDTRYSIGDCEAGSDNVALLDFVKNGHEEFLRVKESVNWTKLKNAIIDDGTKVYLKDSGEIINGMTAYPQPNAFKVKTGRITADDLDVAWLKEDTYETN